ncbi:MAG: cation diffusion facilitator family transporter [Cyanobacteria bacterium]|nr:cation diffusion facilitator family transporter [Cyanobacteriota bacterium]
MHKSGCYCNWIPEKRQWLLPVMVSITGFAAVELWVGWISHSLTLRADSGHMLSDVVALAIALGAAQMAQRSRVTQSQSHRLELLAAMANGLGLLAMAGWIGREAWHHLHGVPGEILSMPMLITASLGLLMNGFNLYWLHDHAQGDLNVRGVALHVLADLMGSVGAIAAALAVTYLGWLWADTLIGLGVAVLIGVSALPLLHQCWRQWWTRPAISETLSAKGWHELGRTDLSQLL